LLWLAQMAERETATTAPAQTTVAMRPVVVLSRDGFAGAVQAALRDLTRAPAQRTPALARNPLLRSRFVIERLNPEMPDSDAQRVAALQEVLRESSETMRDSPREAKFHRTLFHTYWQPAATQEQAAELLDVPFSTYRRHLKSGIEHLTEMLWQREIGA